MPKSHLQDGSKQHSEKSQFPLTGPGLNIRSVTTTHKLRSSPALLPPSQPGNIKQNISNDRRAYHDGTKFASYREWSSKWSHLIMTLMWSSGRRQKEEHLHCDWIIDSVVWNLPLQHQVTLFLLSLVPEKGKQVFFCKPGGTRMKPGSHTHHGPHRNRRHHRLGKPWSNQYWQSLIAQGSSLCLHREFANQLSYNTYPSLFSPAHDGKNGC